jgi:hypothetical protein
MRHPTIQHASIAKHSTITNEWLIRHLGVGVDGIARERTAPVGQTVGEQLEAPKRAKRDHMKSEGIRWD